MKPHQQKAFDFAQDVVKQLLTLATGIIALTVTFAQDFVGGVDPGLRMLAGIAWGGYLASVLFGIWSLLAMAGSLGSEEEPTIYGWNVRVPAFLQILAFLFGLGFTVVYGFYALGAPPTG